MHKLRKAATVAAMVSSIGLVGAGTAQAAGDDGHRGHRPEEPRVVYNVYEVDVHCNIGSVNTTTFPALGVPALALIDHPTFAVVVGSQPQGVNSNVPVCSPGTRTTFNEPNAFETEGLR